MNKDQAVIWNRIRTYEIDDLASSFKFSNRLARENDWSLEYALRTILEYKKFIFLIAISDVSHTPSDQIDQVWHLHLIYTKSYWIDFCKNVLKKDIHHGPTKGSEEGIRFKEQYLHTLEFYELIFKEKPPRDIWLDVNSRFSNIRFTRVDRSKFWLIPKIKLKRNK